MERTIAPPSRGGGVADEGTGAALLAGDEADASAVEAEAIGAVPLGGGGSE
jgi:hypothetical protein